MLASKIHSDFLNELTVRDLEQLLELKKKDTKVSDLLRERDRLRLELRHVEDQIESLERSEAKTNVSTIPTLEEGPGFLTGKRKKSLKDYIAQVLLDAGEPLSPSEIQKRLPEAGYQSSSTNPRSFYNTVFQALQRYDAFSKQGKKYHLSSQASTREARTTEILPKNKTRLKDFIIDVLRHSPAPLKASEIASRVLIAGYKTDLEPDEVNQRVSATLKKYLKSDFDWDSQRYRLASPVGAKIGTN